MGCMSAFALPAWAVERKRSRQYVIGKRRSRQRLAQMLGGGVPPSRAAAVERRSEAEVELLLEDEGFAALVEHYRRFAGLPEEEAVAELRRLARDLLHLALRAGDVRAAVFSAYEELQGRDPATSLARAAIRKARRAAEAPAPRPERRLPPRKPEIIRREADFAWCAATQPSEAEAAVLAAEEAVRLPARVAATGRKLAGAVLAEAEREGTAEVDPLTQSTEAFSRKAHVEGGRAIEAAADWQRRREAFTEDRLGEASASLEPPGDGAPRIHTAATDHHPLSWHASSGPSIRSAGTAAAGHGDQGPAPAAPAPPTMDGPVKQGHDSERGMQGPADSSDTATPPHAVPVPGPHQEAAAGTAAPFSSGGPAPPELPDWLDRVPGANRAQLLAMNPAERAVTLATIAAFYGFDTS
jgi:hypothetical protein